MQKNEKDIAVKAALEVGKIIMRGWKESSIQFAKKYETEIVTKYDREAEKALVSFLNSEFPDYGIVSEEGTNLPSKNEARWILDPIDGTTNFVKRYPLLAISIALECAGEITLGVVYNPIQEELFVAEKGKGATLNGKAIQVSNTNKMDEALVGTGFPYATIDARIDNRAAFNQFLDRALAIRCDGCASLDLCSVACGRFDGYWERGLSAWDIAAGVIIASEAGASVSDYHGAPCNVEQGEVMAATPLLASQIIEILESSK